MAASTHHLQLSDTELLVQLCSEDDDAALYEEFVNRFIKEITAKCHRICHIRKLDEQIGTTIAHECFEKVRKYKSFKPNKIRIKDPQKAILAYLHSFVYNLFNDYHSAVKREQDGNGIKSYFKNILDGVDQKNDPEHLKKIRDSALKALETLKPQEQKILLTDLEYKRTSKYLPDDVIELLSVELGRKKATIRKIRERAIKKIKIAINEA